MNEKIQIKIHYLKWIANNGPVSYQDFSDAFKISIQKGVNIIRRYYHQGLVDAETRREERNSGFGVVLRDIFYWDITKKGLARIKYYDPEWKLKGLKRFEMELKESGAIK